MRIAVVSGAIANRYRNGGATWTRLSFALGLRRLGFRVCFVEQISRDSCVDVAGAPVPFEHSVNRTYFQQIMEEFGLAGSAALVYDEGAAVHGMSWPELLDLAEAADLLVNVSGHLTLEPLKRRLRRKVFIDQDPGFTQFWYAAGQAVTHLEGHDYYFTVGENIGQPGCCIPTGGIRWRPTRQPIVLEHWPVSREGAPDRFTTVGSWRGPYGPIEYQGVTYGLKVHEFRKFVELPQRVAATFEAALEIHPADGKDRELLLRNGWRIVDPKTALPGPAGFRRYLQTSGAEFSVAQGVYAHTNSGWFSDRTVRYLASGKPALVQDTGFGRTYPAGEGLLTFRTLEEAATGAERIVKDYEAHARAARGLAEAYFDSDKVLGRLVEEVGIAL